MTRSRLLTAILIGLFAIVAIIITLLITSGVVGDKGKTQSPNPSSYFIETSPSATP